MVLDVDISLGFAGQGWPVKVKAFHLHLFVDDSSEPMIMQSRILRSGLRLDRESGEVGAVTQLDLAGIVDGGLA